MMVQEWNRVTGIQFTGCGYNNARCPLPHTGFDLASHYLSRALRIARRENRRAGRKVMRVTVVDGHFVIAPMRYVLYYYSEDIAEGERTWSVFREYYTSREDEEPIDGLTRWVSHHLTEDEAQDAVSDLQLFGRRT